MKIIVPIVQFYEKLFYSKEAEVVIKGFNEKERILFDLIRKGEISDDKQAAKKLYDGNPSGQAYSKLKQKLLDKLYKIVINFDYSGNDEGHAKDIQFYKGLFAFDILVRNSTHKAAIQLAKKLVIQAERNFLFHPAIGLAAYLSQISYTYNKDIKLGEKYWNKYLYYKELYENGIEMIHQYALLIQKTKKKDINDQLAKEAHEAYERVKPLVNKNDYKIMRFYYQIGYLRYAAVSEYKGIIENNLEALEYFDKSNPHYQAPRETLLLQIILAYLGMGDYKSASKYLDYSISGATDIKWLEKVSIKTRIHFHLQQYDEAIKIIDETLSSIQFKQARSVTQEQYWLYKYYADIMNYFIHNKPINTRKIRNNMTRLVNDKQGLNIPYVIANVIYELHKNGLNSIYQNEDFLKSYVKSHLKTGNNNRAAIFMSFLLSLPNYKYDQDKFYNQLNKTYEQLEENPATLSIKPDNEIIPYENLMHEILKSFNIKQLKGVEITETTSSAGSAASDQ